MRFLSQETDFPNEACVVLNFVFCKELKTHCVWTHVTETKTVFG